MTGLTLENCLVLDLFYLPVNASITCDYQKVRASHSTTNGLYHASMKGFAGPSSKLVLHRPSHQASTMDMLSSAKG